MECVNFPPYDCIIGHGQLHSKCYEMGTKNKLLFAMLIDIEVNDLFYFMSWQRNLGQFVIIS